VHLAYLAKSTNPQVRMVIYSQPHDPILAREAQLAGAFYERSEYMTHVLPRWLAAALPSSDRRSAARVDRRRTFRGGRRTTDAPDLQPA
jgi:hypothetical protein